MQLLLLIIARFLQLLFSPVLIIWGVIGALKNKQYLQYSNDLAIAIDRFGNCLGKYTFNNLMGVGFGNSKETISSRLGKNEVNKTLKPIGKLVAKILNNLEYNHCIKSIDNQV